MYTLAAKGGGTGSGLLPGRPVGRSFEDLLPELPGGDAAFAFEEVGEVVFVVEIQFPGDLLDRQAGFAQQQRRLELS